MFRKGDMSRNRLFQKGDMSANRLFHKGSMMEIPYHNPFQNQAPPPEKEPVNNLEKPVKEEKPKKRRH